MISIDLYHHITNELLETIKLPSVPTVEDQIVLGGPIIDHSGASDIDEENEQCEVWVVADRPFRWYPYTTRDDNFSIVAIQVMSLQEYKNLRKVGCFND